MRSAASGLQEQHARTSGPHEAAIPTAEDTPQVTRNRGCSCNTPEPSNPCAQHMRPKRTYNF
eukprot:10516187-Alexandrium_andersonii.AAC.1